MEGESSGEVVSDRNRESSETIRVSSSPLVERDGRGTRGVGGGAEGVVGTEDGRRNSTT